MTAIFSDIYDGIIARRLHIETPLLRRYDSVADTIFYLAVAWAAWRLHPEVIRENAAILIALFSLEILRYVFDFVNSAARPAYHVVFVETVGAGVGCCHDLSLCFWDLGLAFSYSVGARRRLQCGGAGDLLCAAAMDARRSHDRARLAIASAPARLTQDFFRGIPYPLGA